MATKKPKLEKSVIKKANGHGGARIGAGRDAFNPTDAERKQVEAMSGYGLPIEHIAVLIRNGISADTLTKYFGPELISGKAKANSSVGRTLFQKAINGDTTAMIWWSKTQMRWKDTSHLELSGLDGGAVQMEQVRRVIVDPKNAGIP